ncbi:MAG: MFS transporter [Promethearchaeota archaeon]
MSDSEKEKVNNNKEQSSGVEERLPKHKWYFFGFGAMTDQMSHQAFQLLVFTFYFSVVGININYLMWGFIIFAIWDSLNDPLIGTLSDKTVSRFGRRGFWVLLSIVPFGLINIFLFIYPHTSNEFLVGAYMIIIIMLYDLFYTMFSSMQTALFPEMFKDETERGRANKIKNILTIVGVLLGFVLPTLLISPMAPTSEADVPVVAKMYLKTGILIGTLVIIFGFIFYKLGIKERPQEIIKPEEMPGLVESLKMTLKNKTFIIFVISNLFNWFVYKMLTTIIPLYGQYVLGIAKGSIMLTLLLLVALLTAAVMFPILEKLGLKYGMRNTFIATDIIWILALIPFAIFDGAQDQTSALIAMIFMGIGLAGTMYFVDIIIGSIIDEDEVKNGKRREGTFYGVNALINRYSTILVFVAIAVVLNGYGWGNYLLDADLTQITNLKIGLKVLLVGLDIIVLLVVIILLKIFPLHGKKLEEVNEKIKEIRKQQAEYLKEKNGKETNG